MQKYLIFGLIIALSVCTAPVAACCSCDQFTQGYWKNHPDWPSPPCGVDYGKFFSSGQTWLEVLQTPPKGGNAYYILAHQYIAAKLNVCNGCWAPCGICTAEELFNKYTPADIGGLKGNDPLRQQFLELAAYLDDYNNRNLNT